MCSDVRKLARCCPFMTRARGKKTPVDPDDDDDLPWGHEGYEVGVLRVLTSITPDALTGEPRKIR